MDIHSLTVQEILSRISRHCPKALTAYLHCMNRVNPKNKIFFSREMIEIEMSESFSIFKNNLKKLAHENLLEWYPFNDGLVVTMADINEDE